MPSRSASRSCARPRRTTRRDRVEHSGLHLRVADDRASALEELAGFVGVERRCCGVAVRLVGSVDRSPRICNGDARSWASLRHRRPDDSNRSPLSSPPSRHLIIEWMNEGQSLALLDDGDAVVIMVKRAVVLGIEADADQPARRRSCRHARCSAHRTTRTPGKRIESVTWASGRRTRRGDDRAPSGRPR